MKSPTDVLSVVCAKCYGRFKIRRAVFSVYSMDRSTAKCPYCETDLQLSIDEQTDAITTEPMAQWLERHGQMAIPFKKKRKKKGKKAMSVISFRVTRTEQCLTDIARGTGTKQWYERIVSSRHITPQLAVRLANEGLIKVRWWPKDSPLKALLGLQRCRRVGSARLTSKGRRWLHENAVAPAIGLIVEATVRRITKKQQAQL